MAKKVEKNPKASVQEISMSKSIATSPSPATSDLATRPAKKSVVCQHDYCDVSSI